MANTILVGAQWGDEGKGKIIDVLTEQADVVVRTQGGNNAGHTVFIGNQKYVLHIVPSGILRKRKMCVIGNGVVIDPLGLVEEIDGLLKLGIRVDDNLLVSETAHLVFPYHRELDAQREILKGKNRLGTTKRGIGPAYGDKAARAGLRLIDLINPPRFETLLRAKIKENNEILKAFGARALSFKEVHAAYRAAGDGSKKNVANTVVLLHDAMRQQKDILFEGAQGTFLDIDHGTYPFVTSSNTTAGGACTGSGVPPHRLDRVVGVMKAYTTRPGARLSQSHRGIDGREVGDCLRRSGPRADNFPVSSSSGFVHKQVPNRRRGSEKTTLTLTPSRPMGYVFSMVAARAAGARRLRRFRVAQARGGCGKDRRQAIAAVMRPEGRAPARIS